MLISKIFGTILHTGFNGDNELIYNCTLRKQKVRKIGLNLQIILHSRLKWEGGGRVKGWIYGGE